MGDGVDRRVEAGAELIEDRYPYMLERSGLSPTLLRLWIEEALAAADAVDDRDRTNDPMASENDDAIHIASPWDARISLCGNWHRRNLQLFEKTDIDEGGACWTCCMAWKAIDEWVTARSSGAVSQGGEDHRCPDCKGTGFDQRKYPAAASCPVCGGSGSRSPSSVSDDRSSQP